MGKILHSLKNAFFGLKYCFITQQNMVIHILVGGLVLLAGILMGIPAFKMLFVLTAITLLLVAEVFNTALEYTIDLYSRERSRPAQIAKDVAAGAVLLTAVLAVIIVLVIIGPPLWELVKMALPVSP